MEDVEVIFIPGKYRTIVTKLSRLIIHELKTTRKIKKEHDVILFKEVINENIPLHFYLGLNVSYSNKLYVTGDAYNPTGTWDEQIPYIEVTIETNEDPKDRREISFRLANILRHEIEHLTQSGFNTLPGKYLKDDQYKRGKATQKEYLLLPKEIPAAVHGIYSQAFKMKIPFDKMLNEYLLETYLLESEIEEVAEVYLEKAKELNLWKNMM